VRDGQSFGAALGAHPRVFSDYYRASVLAGEQSGQLDQVMGHLAAFVENRARNAQAVQLALLYPALLAVVSAGIITLLMAYVVPDIVRVFTARGANLPLLTRALIGASAAVRDWGLAALLAALAAGLGFHQWLKAPANKLRFDRWLATARPTARLVTRINAAQFSGTLATLVRSRVPLVEALSAAASATPNRFVRAQVEGRRRAGARGGELARRGGRGQVLPPHTDRDDRERRGGRNAGRDARSGRGGPAARPRRLGADAGGAGGARDPAADGGTGDADGAGDLAADRVDEQPRGRLTGARAGQNPRALARAQSANG
jgi:general secretion pathway protein F